MFRCQVLGSPSLSTLTKERTLHLFLLARSLSSTVSYRPNNMCVVCVCLCVCRMCVFVYVHMCALVCWNQSSMLDVSFSLKFLRQGLSMNLSHWVSSSPVLMFQTCPQHSGFEGVGISGPPPYIMFYSLSHLPSPVSSHLLCPFCEVYCLPLQCSG